jgi:D-xylose transport system substrate-binding protein
MAGRTVPRMVRLAFAVAVAMLLAAACATTKSSGGGGGGGGQKTIALLLPETKTTRYEQQDKPNFVRKVK